MVKENINGKMVNYILVNLLLV